MSVCSSATAAAHNTFTMATMTLSTIMNIVGGFLHIPLVRKYILKVLQVNPEIR
jgi:hypothetical protein